ncbi:MAG: flavohemoglobin expression-modulating QEGLA motif protein [Legionellaceae bacterium]|nr:flavohemoglobin expression-modulating QEGLA motif protein [Legionellaceae bacterium]
MTLGEQELIVIKQLSSRLIEAQRKIRILDSIKWDHTIENDFFKKNAQSLPIVDKDYYKTRPLPFKPKEKKEEFRGILRDAQNTLGQYSHTTRLIKRQCEEYIKAINMLSARGTPRFCELSNELFGSPDDAFYANGPRLSNLGIQAFNVLSALDIQLQSDTDVKKYTPNEAQAILHERLSHFFNKDPGRVTVMVSDGMVADASAGADTIRLNESAMFSDRDIRYLEVHEGWVHVGTTLNGAAQPYCSFLSKGSPSCSVLQEGLAVITEVVTFSSYPGRMRRITNRVVALDKIREGANFLDIYQYFLECGSEEKQSYKDTVRLFRGSVPDGGAFTKDISYAKGFILVYNFIRFAISQHRIDVIPLLFSGKLVLDDLPLLISMRDEGLLLPPIYLPPPFQDLAALSTWMSFSLIFNKFDLSAVIKDFGFLLGS